MDDWTAGLGSLEWFSNGINTEAACPLVSVPAVMTREAGDLCLTQ